MPDVEELRGTQSSFLMGQPPNRPFGGPRSVAPQLRPPLHPGAFPTSPTWAKFRLFKQDPEREDGVSLRSPRDPLQPFEPLSSNLPPLFCESPGSRGEFGVSPIPLVPSPQAMEGLGPSTQDMV